MICVVDPRLILPAASTAGCDHFTTAPLLDERDVAGAPSADPPLPSELVDRRTLPLRPCAAWVRQPHRHGLLASR